MRLRDRVLKVRWEPETRVVTLVLERFNLLRDFLRKCAQIGRLDPRARMHFE